MSNNYYPTELHCHTIESDGKMTIEELVDSAMSMGYKAIALTDHNTTSGVKRAKDYGKKQGLIVISGIEWTLFFGHLTILGGNNKIDWRTITTKNIVNKLQEAINSGDFTTMAHPFRWGSPICTGCYNETGITDWSNIGGYEVWSMLSPHTNFTNDLSLKQWVSLLDKGYKLNAIYGRDWHSNDNKNEIIAITYIGADCLSEKGFLDGLKKGKTYISYGLQIECSVEYDSTTYGFGDSIIMNGDDYVKAKISIKVDKTYQERFSIIPQEIRMFSNSNNLLIISPNCDNMEADIFISGDYIRVEVIGSIKGNSNQLLAVCTPIYITRGAI